MMKMGTRGPQKFMTLDWVEAMLANSHYCIVVFDPVGNKAMPYSTDTATVQHQIANDVKGI